MSGNGVFTVFSLGMVSTLAFDYGGFGWSFLVFMVLGVVFTYMWWVSGGSKGGRPSYKFS